MSSFYVTTPIYYVNDLPHIGHVYSTVVCDVIARYRRLAGERTYFLTGTDEHGQKIERAAAERGLAPIELADRVVQRYHELWRELAISHDDFIRTTEERHQAGVREMVARMRAAGDLYVDRHEGWYCTACETFYTEKELEGDEHLCPVHGTSTEWKSEENVFFRLSRYADRLLAWYRDDPRSVLPESRRNEVRSFVEGGLKDLSVSRASLAWGVPFPDQPGQTVYVWLDALTNYVSALGFGRQQDELYRTFWEEGDTRLHVVGKDILRFHAVYWPAFLLSAGLPLPTTVWAHGWWTFDRKKVSKSAGNVPRTEHLVERFGADSLRYFLLREMVFGQDAGYSDEGFIERYNSDLANDLGNSVSRLVTLSRRIFDGGTPPVPCDDNPLVPAARRAAGEYREAMDELAFQSALQALWRLLAEANGYLVEREPWKRVKDEGPSESISRILWNGLEAVRIVATGLLPFMPRVAPRVLRAIGALPEDREPPGDLDAMTWGGLPTGAPLPEPEALFPRIDKEAYVQEVEAAGPPSGSGAGRGGGGDSDADTTEEPTMISIDQFFQTQLRVATVKAAEAIPKSSKLLKLTVDLGDETRTVVAGIAKEYEPEALVGKQVVIVANLEPAKLMGVESQGMVLAAEVDGRPILLHPEEAVPNGCRVK